MIEFQKYEGAGNDFVMIDNRKGDFITDQATIQKMCHRRFGIGADGLILLENDPDWDFSMRYFNADGLEGSMCGNGGRCIVWFAHKLQITKTSTTFRAIDGFHKAQIKNAGNSGAIVKLEMIDVKNICPHPDGWELNTGSPHFVKPVEFPENTDVISEGKKIRYDERFRQEGVNVNFVAVKNGEILIRTYERGVEDETLACGTGITASAIALHENNESVASPAKVVAKGGSLKVYFEKAKNGYKNIWLEGPAKYVFSGTWPY